MHLRVVHRKERRRKVSACSLPSLASAGQGLSPGVWLLQTPSSHHLFPCHPSVRQIPCHLFIQLWRRRPCVMNRAQPDTSNQTPSRWFRKLSQGAAVSDIRVVWEAGDILEKWSSQEYLRRSKRLLFNTVSSSLHHVSCLPEHLATLLHYEASILFMFFSFLRKWRHFHSFPKRIIIEPLSIR